MLVKLTPDQQLLRRAYDTKAFEAMEYKREWKARQRIKSLPIVKRRPKNGKSILETSFWPHPHGCDRHGRLQKGQRLHGRLQIW